MKDKGADEEFKKLEGQCEVQSNKLKLLHSTWEKLWLSEQINQANSFKINIDDVIKKIEDSNNKLKKLLESYNYLAEKPYFSNRVYDGMMVIASIFREQIEEVRKQNSSDNELKEMREKYEKMSKLYENLLAKEDKGKPLENVASPKLLNIKDFSKFLTDWKYWISRYHSTSDNKTKLYLLKQTVGGCKDATKFVELFNIDEDKYEECLSKLEERFKFTRNLASVEFEKLINISKNVTNNHNSGHGLRKTYDEFVAAQTSFEAIVREVSNINKDDENREIKLKAAYYDAVMYTMINRGVDKLTKLAFAAEDKTPSDAIPSGSSYLKFINTRSLNYVAAENKTQTEKRDHKTATKFQPLKKQTDRKPEKKAQKVFIKENVGPQTSKTQPYSKKQPESSNKKCQICKADDHNTYQCQVFKPLTVPDRISIIKSNKLCLNCLKNSNYCKCKETKRSFCKKCTKLHNDIIHK